MTLAEKIAQLGSVLDGRRPATATAWRADAGPVLSDDQPPLEEPIKNGLGQLTRVFGTAPVTAAAGCRARSPAAGARSPPASRLGIPAVAHEECLTGFAAWAATIFPTPLAWGASLRPGPRRRDGGRRSARPCARSACTRGSRPVLDVTRDYRWGRTEETIGEDPYLVGSDRHRVRARAAVGPGCRPRSSTSPPTPPPGPGGTCPGVHGAARARRRHPRSVRDGHQARRRALGDARPTSTSTACLPARIPAC